MSFQCSVARLSVANMQNLLHYIIQTIAQIYFCWQLPIAVTISHLLHA